ncbi:MAG: hypothetical protein AMXMBFR64_62870 [Myxococcales bacterium]
MNTSRAPLGYQQDDGCSYTGPIDGRCDEGEGEGGVDEGITSGLEDTASREPAGGEDGAPAPAAPLTVEALGAILHQNNQHMLQAMVQAFGGGQQQAAPAAAPTGDGYAPPSYLDAIPEDDPLRAVLQAMHRENYDLRQEVRAAAGKVGEIDNERGQDKFLRQLDSALAAAQVPSHGTKLAKMLANAICVVQPDTNPAAAVKFANKLLGEFGAAHVTANAQRKQAPGLRAVPAPGAARTPPKDKNEAKAALLAAIQADMAESA